MDGVLRGAWHNAPPVGRIQALREAYPRWGKAKLAVLLARERWEVSVSTVGGTLGRVRGMGHLREPRVPFVRRG